MPFRLLRLGPLIARLFLSRRPRQERVRQEIVRENPEIETVRTGGQTQRAGVEHLPGEDAHELPWFQKRTIFSERIFSRSLFLIFTAGALLSGWLIFASPAEGDPVTSAAISIVTILFFVFFFLAVNFSSMSLRITFDHISVRYGIFSYRADLLSVADISMERKNGSSMDLPGIRMKAIKGGAWRLYYSAGLPRVILHFREGAIRELAFSTRSPEKVVTIARDCVKRKEARTARSATGPAVKVSRGPGARYPEHLLHNDTGRIRR